MQIKFDHIITLEVDDQTIQVTPKQFVELHDAMTTLYNEHYKLITKEADND